MKAILGFFGSKLVAGIVLALLVFALAGWGLAYKRGSALDVALAKGETCATQRDTALGAATSAVESAGVFKGLHEQCMGERSRVREANADAVRAAVAKTKREMASKDDFNKRLRKPTAGCDAIKLAQVCPSLRDY